MIMSSLLGVEMASLIDRFRKPKTYKARRDPKKIREKIIDKSLAISIATDPDVERQWLENNYGIYVGFDNDPITNRVAELEIKLSNNALQILGQDEKHQESAIRALIDEIKNLNALSKRTNDQEQPGFQIIEESSQSNPHTGNRNLRKDLIKQFEDIGKNNSPVENDNATTRLLLELVKKISSASPGGNSSRMIAVEVDGRFVEMNSVDYSIFKKQREELLAARAKLKDIPQ
jgi:hypothetical protein